jgi:hypothetical protein
MLLSAYSRGWMIVNRRDLQQLPSLPSLAEALLNRLLLGAPSCTHPGLLLLMLLLLLQRILPLLLLPLLLPLVLT